MAASERQLSIALTAGSGEGLLGSLVLWSYLLLWAGTLLAALLAWPFAGALHSLLGLRLVSHRSASTAVAIALNNAREAAIPLGCALALRGPGRRLVRLGDVVVGACLAGNVVLAGVALGAYGPGLLAQLPHWPVEWAAFAVALSAWRRARAGRRDLLELLLLAIACGVLLCTGALIETYTTPNS